MTNRQIAAALRELGLHLEMDEVAFKPRAYDVAAELVERYERPLEDLVAEGGVKALSAIPGIGKGIAERIGELLSSGHISDLDEARRKRPVDLLELVAVEGLGARKVRALHEALGIRDLDDLERAARAGQIRELTGFGVKSEEKLLAGIELRRQASERLPLGRALPLAERIAERLGEVAGVERVMVAGSIRRFRETVGDADFLVQSSEPEAVMEAFVSMPEVVAVHAHGSTKTMVRLEEGLDADLRVLPAQSFGAAVNYFTGSKAHNIALRRIAQEQGLKLSEYGLFRGEEQIAGSDEREIYQLLGLEWVPPEMREGEGEIEAAREGRLPELIEPGALRGDLQIQTDWTDGSDSLERMAELARGRGLDYIAITDHTRDLAMTGGLDEAGLRRQGEAIRKLNQRLRGFRVLRGAEVNIRRDGSLDIDDECLAELELVGAAIHSHFGLDREEQTRRLVRAIENPHVDVIFHPSCRVFGKRQPIELELEAVLEACRRTGTALEIDAHPGRLDLSAGNVRRALEHGVKLVIDSDAHAGRELEYPERFGVGHARRGWARGEDVLNTLPVEELLAALEDGREG